jgi:hypothetical protein
MATTTFASRPDDVFIASYPRSGTTWLQMIVWQLSTAGTGTFEHISEVIPFFEYELQRGRTFEELPSPRVFKTHLPFRRVGSRPGRYIYIARDGRDVMLSYFRYYVRYIDSAESFESFFDKFMAGRVLYGSWFSHVADWNAHAGDRHVCCLRYEELVETFDACLERLSSFCGWPLSTDRRRAIEDACSLASMKQAEHKFAPIEDRGGAHGFLRTGASGEWRNVLTPAQQEAFEHAASLKQLAWRDVSVDYTAG